MPLSLAGNIELFEESSIFKFQKSFDVILSKYQTEKQQSNVINNALNHKSDFYNCIEHLENNDFFSFIFILTQFGNINESELPPNFLNYQNNPYIFKTKTNDFIVPWEFIQHFSKKQIFHAQNYLFARMAKLSKEELKSWYFWIKNQRIDKKPHLHFQLYSNAKKMQTELNLDSIQENEEIYLKKVWNRNSTINLFYNSEIGFYEAMQRLEKVEKSPQKQKILSLIKCGRLVPKNLRSRNLILIYTTESICPKFQSKDLRYNQSYI